MYQTFLIRMKCILHIYVLRIWNIHRLQMEHPSALFYTWFRGISCKNRLNLCWSSSNQWLSQQESQPRFVVRFRYLQVLKMWVNMYRWRILWKYFCSLPQEWVCVGEWVSSSSVITLGTAPRHLLPGPPGAQLPFIITAATADSSIYAINRDSMQQVKKWGSICYFLWLNGILLWLFIVV